MSKILGYIRKNTLKIIVIVLFIIFIYSFIKAGNNAYREQEKQVVSDKSNTSVNIKDSDCKKIINNFLNSCTSGKYEEAYAYLSEECKNENYKTLDDFINNYCVKKSIKGKDFSFKKDTSKSGYTYIIEFNNMLSSGKKDNKIQKENYTIVVENENELRLNIEG